MKRMNAKRRVLVLLTTLLLLAGSSKAQVFIADDEFEGMMRRADPDYVLVVPLQGTDADQYTPIGSGALLLAGLGGAYLLTKRKKKE